MISLCRTAMTLAPTVQAPGEGRQFLRQQLCHNMPQKSLDTALLLVSELVTNAVRHAHTEIELAVTVEPTKVCVEVSDGCPDPPTVHYEHSPNSEGRWGMVLLSVLSDSWGVLCHPHGKTVWFSLARHVQQC
jgi:anti-sigma regulatory factor (Ser/Thr protein kinase)